MKRHKHKMGPWTDGGPRRKGRVIRDRFCIEVTCECGEVCCWETAEFKKVHVRWVRTGDVV